MAALRREFEDEADAVTRLLSRGTTGREEGEEQRLEQGRLRLGDPLLPGQGSTPSDSPRVTP